MPLGIVSKASEMLRVATRPNGRFAIETNQKPSLDIFASGLSCLDISKPGIFGRIEVEKWTHLQNDEYSVQKKIKIHPEDISQLK